MAANGPPPFKWRELVAELQRDQASIGQLPPLYGITSLTKDVRFKSGAETKKIPEIWHRSNKPKHTAILRRKESEIPIGPVPAKLWRHVLRSLTRNAITIGRKDDVINVDYSDYHRRSSLETILSFVLPASLLTGIATVDEEHYRLVTQINSIADMESTNDNSGARLHLARFVADLAEHFSWEDEYLARLEYPKSAEHIERHAQIISFLAGLLEKANRNDVNASRIADQCFDKLVHTVIMDDFEYVNWLEARRGATKPL